MRRIFNCALSGMIAAGFIFSDMAGIHAVEALSPVGCSVPALVAAINAANVGGGGTLDLSAGCTYDLTAIDNGPANGTADGGPNGLPQITQAITINGHGATIQRDFNAPAFRIFYIAVSGSLTLNNLTLQNGLARGDAGQSISGGTTGSPGGQFSGLGGAIYSAGRLNLSGVTLVNNQAVGGAGGAINNGAGGGSGGAGAGLGGAIFGAGSAITITNSTLTGNQASGGAGGATTSFGGTITGAGGGGLGGKGEDNGGGGAGAGSFGGGGGGAGGSFSGGNAGHGGFGGGGGGASAGTNAGIGGFAGGNGGSNTLLFGTGGGGAGLGGAIFIQNGRLSLVSSTVAGNAALGGNAGNGGSFGNPGQGGSGFGGGVFIDNTTIDSTDVTTNPTLILQNTILAGNSTNAGSGSTNGSAAASEVYSTVSASLTDDGHNLVQNTDANLVGLTGSGDLTGVSPLLGSLANNGGLTETLALQSGSPAIKAGGCGSPNAVTVDQRNNGRKTVCDIGAFETSPTITVGTLPNGLVGVPYSQTVLYNSTDPGATPFTFAISGSLPNGLSLNASTGLISGTPITEGTSLFTLIVTDSHGYSASQTQTISIAPVIVLSPLTLPPAIQHQTYSQTISASNGAGPYTYYLIGTLPTGITLSTSGTLNGSTAQSGSFTFTVVAIDSHYFSGQQSYTLTVQSPTATPTVTATATFTPMATATPTSTPAPARIDSIGIYRGGTFYLRLHNTTGNADLSAAFTAGTRPYPIVGDWIGSGFDSIGVMDQANANFYLRNTITAGSADETFTLGNANDTPLSGRWQISATHAGAGVYRPSNGVLYLKNVLSTGFADNAMVMGLPGDAGIAGDWTGKGFDSPGVFRPGNMGFFLSNKVTNGSVFADITFTFGSATDLPIAGDWIAQGHDGIGMFRPTNGFVYLKNVLTTGFADNSFFYGAAGDVPIAGHWQVVYPPAPPAPILIAKTAIPQSGGGIVPGGNQIGG